MTDELQTFA